MPPLLFTDGRRIAEISLLRASQNQRQRNPDSASSGLAAIGAILSFQDRGIWLKEQIVFVIVHSIKQAAEKRPSGAPAYGISQGSTCICLPARSRFGEGRGIFEQPAKHGFFSKLLESQQLKKDRTIR